MIVLNPTHVPSKRETRVETDIWRSGIQVSHPSHRQHAAAGAREPAPTRQVAAGGPEVRRRRPWACGRRGPYPTVLGPAAPAAPLTRGRIADAGPPQWPGQLSRRLPRRGHRTASLPQPSPLRACSQFVGSCHSRASKDGRQRYAAVIHGHRKRPLSCGFVHKLWTTPN
jgi:hypothetical protein